MDRIDFYYFSGTGNTLLVIRKMKEVFESHGMEVNLFRMEKTDPSEVNVSHLIGLGFPVAEQGTYPFVWDFISALPPAQGTRIFMVDTLLAFSGGAVGPVKKIVKAKGYTPIGAKEIRMPNNLFPGKIIPEKVEKKVRKRARRRRGNTPEDIPAGRSRWRRFPIVRTSLSRISRSEASWKFFKRFYPLEIDREKCTKCGLCVTLCPVKNIKMNEYPEFLRQMYDSACAASPSAPAKRSLCRESGTRDIARYRQGR